ncbi:MAG: hypothetical protein A2297_03940 [Elusimicrobia bacterium RIFOXYB2_FULL_48_7]|nr:MAG: hypothetical protein A2297_03940 [Elusimicrobia bacterium RIFOXYB2_FULL_48_7]
MHPFEFKEAAQNKPIETFPEPETVIIPLSQHTGAPCEPLVKPGDKVKAGQKIGDSKSFISAPVHSSVSGEVVSIEDVLHPLMQKKVRSVIIKNDKKNELHESVKPPADVNSLGKKELIDIIRDKGIVGMGGAMFPSYVKLQPPKPVDTLLINGCECEPWLTADHRVMLEHADEILGGINILMKILGVKKTIIAIETNKPEAIAKFEKLTESCRDTITIAALPAKYPQGAEKTLIKKTLGREVQAGQLPLDVGVVVSNTSTVLAVNNAVARGLPLIERIVTVSGMACAKPGNYKIKIGTPLANIIDHCFDKTLAPKLQFKMGGPMMGVVQDINEANTPLIKGSTGIIALQKPEVEAIPDRTCIKCGRCFDVCPMELCPSLYAIYHKLNKPEESEKNNIRSCIECGCCEYICSSRISLVSIIKNTKSILNKAKAS